MAIVTPSWGGPAAQPARYALGRRVLEERFGLEVVATANALAEWKWLARHPEARADDLHEAFRDPSVRAIVASIGGDDAIRVLPHLDLSVIAANPKVFLGFSDATSIHFACTKAGLTSFYGPNLMPGLAENGEPFEYTVDALQRTLFETRPLGRIEPNRTGWTSESIDWNDAKIGNRRRLHESQGPRTLQGSGTARGPLIGGCAESLALLKETAWWPDLETWRGAVLFYETYDASKPDSGISTLRDFGAQGILAVLNGIIVGRPGGCIEPARHRAYEAAVMRALTEVELTDLPVIANLDFGHTDPVFTLPYGVVAEMNCETAALTLIESGVSADAD